MRNVVLPFVSLIKITYSMSVCPLHHCNNTALSFTTSRILLYGLT